MRDLEKNKKYYTSFLIFDAIGGAIEIFLANLCSEKADDWWYDSSARDGMELLSTMFWISFAITVITAVIHLVKLTQAPDGSGSLTFSGSAPSSRPSYSGTNSGPSSPSSVKYCLTCGYQANRAASVCTRCGHPFDNATMPPTGKKMYCGDCGAPVDSSQRFCPNCGSNLPLPNEENP